MAASFDCVVTRDEGFAESAARALRSDLDFGMVVLRLAQKPWPQYRQTFLEAWSVSPNRPVAGRLVQWP